MLAGIRMIQTVPETFEGLTWQLLKMIPSDYARVDLIADSYKEHSIKDTTRKERAISFAEKIIIRSEKSKIPKDFQSFLSDGSNKNRMIELIFSVIERNKNKVLNQLRCPILYLSAEGFCHRITISSNEDYKQLISDQEEADTQLILHAMDALLNEQTKSVLLRSTSGDTDIILLAIFHLNEFKDNVFIDNGRSDHRRIIQLSSFNLEDHQVLALLGYHTFTGNNYVSSFSKKGKKTTWKIANTKIRFNMAFAALGSQLELPEDVFLTLEEFVCYLYGGKSEKNVDNLRFHLFRKKNRNENKIIDLATLPPCQSVLNLHAQRSNLVAYMWKNALRAKIQLPNPQDHGWSADYEIQWVEEVYPNTLEAIILKDIEEESVDMELGIDVLSDFEDDD